jgi:hypothetical protein
MISIVTHRELEHVLRPTVFMPSGGRSREPLVRQAKDQADNLIEYTLDKATNTLSAERQIKP